MNHFPSHSSFTLGPSLFSKSLLIISNSLICILLNNMLALPIGVLVSEGKKQFCLQSTNKSLKFWSKLPLFQFNSSLKSEQRVISDTGAIKTTPPQPGLVGFLLYAVQINCILPSFCFYKIPLSSSKLLLALNFSPSLFLFISNF